MALNWDLPFLEAESTSTQKYALIILNQPFSYQLLHRLWQRSSWRCCADGGANRLLDSVRTQSIEQSKSTSLEIAYLPDLIKGDLDSLRLDVKDIYLSQGVAIVQDHDQYSTDLMKCVCALAEKEQNEDTKYDIIILGGLSGRLDQTIHTLSYLHKLRKVRERVFVATDENVAWLLDTGEHRIIINHRYLGQTCGLLPVGIDTAVLTTQGLKWNLTDTESSFDGMVSTSNHLLPEEPTVYIKTSKPIVWTVELKANNL
ncbi:thiamine pyrophosphokinase Thi80 [Cytidiella melzeri]|nr:thiamine pyrophosphokinase Thi80 [Cytidiella melzeri]